jgi:hypothetical protein
MTFIGHIEERFGLCVQMLGLDAVCGRVLHALVVLDVDGPEHQDVHGRQGIISWYQMVESLLDDDTTVAAVEAAVVRLADWAMIQIVGRSTADPKLTGTSALRLTHAGRVCLGLAPAETHPVTLGDDQPWHVWHHANREGLLFAVESELRGVGFRPIQANGDRQGLDALVGAVAASLITHGAAVVDGFSVAEADRGKELSELLFRTRSARGPRFLLLPEPVAIRIACAAVQADLRWVEPRLDTRRDSNDLDERVSTALIGTGIDRIADACGVPKSNLAQPRRVQIKWDELLVPDGVRTQIEQAMQHADFRLNVLPTLGKKRTGYRLLLSGLPGTGKSMAGEALATKLSRPVVKLDLSTVLSKWLGETEQLIGQVFDMAEAAGAVLVLDEAEALFRQRQSGGSSGSNAMLTAVAYLLTRLDRFEGVLVATTNRTQDIDDALFRRFDDYIILPVPDHDTRMALWRQQLGAHARNFSDDEFDLLGRHFVITGGLVRGAAIRASAWAYAHGEPVTMPFVLASLARELEKSDHPTSHVLTQPWRQRVADLLNDKRYPALP